MTPTATTAFDVRFDATPADRKLIDQIVDRALGIIAEWETLSQRDRMKRRVNLRMDLTACHLNGNPLDLGKLLAADDFNVMHDVGGIARHIDRNTGKLTGFFSPRCSAREGVPA